MYFQADGEDDLKKRQLMELAIINGTYRDSTSKPGKFVTIFGHSICNLLAFVSFPSVEFRCDFPSGFEAEQLKMLPTPILRHVGTPLIISPQQMLTQHQVLNGTGPQLMAPPDAASLIYSRAYDFTTQYAHNLLAPHIVEFQPGANGGVGDTLSTGGLIQLAR